MPALAVLLLRRASLARERARAVKARGRGASRARRELLTFSTSTSSTCPSPTETDKMYSMPWKASSSHTSTTAFPAAPFCAPRCNARQRSGSARARGPVPAGAARGGRGSARGRARPPTHASPGHPHTPAPMPPACRARAASSHAVLRAPGSGAPRGCRRRRARPRTRGGSAPRCATAGQRTARWRCSRSHSAHHGCALLPADPAATVGPKLQQRFVFELFQVRASRPRTLVRLEV